MKKTILVAMAAMLMSASTFARVFVVNKEATLNKRATELKAIIMDTENYCDNGCRYKLTNVREMKVVEKTDEDHVYTWLYIDAARDSTNFNYTEVTKDAAGAITIKSGFPEFRKIKELKEKTGLAHATLFSDIDTSWVLTEQFDDQGQFVSTKVAYKTKATGSSLALRLFGGLVQSGLEQTAREMFKVLTDN